MINENTNEELKKLMDMVTEVGDKISQFMSNEIQNHKYHFGNDINKFLLFIHILGSFNLCYIYTLLQNMSKDIHKDVLTKEEIIKDIVDFTTHINLSFVKIH
jgi:hypothetical protein